MTGLRIDQLSIGQSESFSKTISESDIYMFAGITGDLNPAHVNEMEALKTPFKGRIAHGMLSAGLISAVLGMKLPGPGTIYLKQDLAFVKPVHMGDTVTAMVTVAELISEKNMVKLDTVCMNQHSEIVIKGAATVLAPR